LHLLLPAAISRSSSSITVASLASPSHCFWMHLLRSSTDIGLSIRKAQPMIHLHSLIDKVLAFIYIFIAVVSSMPVAQGIRISTWLMVVSVDLVIIDSSSSSSIVAFAFATSRWAMLLLLFHLS